MEVFHHDLHKYLYLTNNKNGILVSPGNKEEICRGIDTFIGNKDKILEMGENLYKVRRE